MNEYEAINWITKVPYRSSLFVLSKMHHSLKTVVEVWGAYLSVKKIEERKSVLEKLKTISSNVIHMIILRIPLTMKIKIIFTLFGTFVVKNRVEIVFDHNIVNILEFVTDHKKNQVLLLLKMPMKLICGEKDIQNHRRKWYL